MGKRSRKNKVFIFLFVWMLFSIAPGLPMGVGSGYAQTAPPKSPSITKATTEKVDHYHQRTEKLLLDSAEWVDSFFGTENYMSEVNKTHLRFRLSGFLEEGSDFDASARFTLRLKLPNTEKRFRLSFASSPDDIDDQDRYSEDDTVIRQPEEADNNLTGALEYFFLDKNRHNMKFSVGATIRDYIPVVYGSTRYRYLVDVRRWTMRFVQRFRWYSDDGWDSRSEMDFERPVLDYMFFRTTPSLTWRERRDGFEYNWLTSLFHPLNNISAMEYQFNTYFDTEISGRLKQMNLRANYRRQLWRKWLIMEIAPQLAWYEERDFQTVPGITVRLEIWMGRYGEMFSSPN